MRLGLPAVLGRLTGRASSTGGAEAGLEGLSAADRPIVEAALPHTMTGVARLQSVIDAVRHCSAREIDGAFAECGVWRGGSVFAMVLTLQELGTTDRDIYLYDTFEGMTTPTSRDVSNEGLSALATWKRASGRLWPEVFGPDAFDEAAVRELLRSTGYPESRIHLVKGPVEQTIPEAAPAHLALLRLDTDWYESTRHELLHLYPRLREGGVLLIDDYGHWEGCRQAVDEYFDQHPPRPLLHRVDYTGVAAVKL